jgi:hypothetical protein
MTFDAADAVVLLFGGLGGAEDAAPVAFNDLWAWDGASWTKLTPSGTLPSARAGAGFVFDAAMAASILFGGAGVGEAPKNDLWVWDEGSWSPVAVTGMTPAGRSYFPMVYDPSDETIAVFGGCGTATCTSPLSDTWIFDGESWTAQSAGPGASAPGTASMAYDPDTEESFLFGAPPSQSTWAWDGSSWSSVTPAMSPSARTRATEAFDAAHGVIVLFGGAGATMPLGDTWIYDTLSWSNATP